MKQCFALTNKTGEGLRMSYGYGGVGSSPSVMKIGLHDMIQEQCCKDSLRARSEFAKLTLERLC